jgi:glucokinase
MMAEAIYLGVDIGGTKVAAGLVSATGDILVKTRVPMECHKDAETGYRSVHQAIEAALALKPEARALLCGIGISSPGPLDPRAGIVVNPPNLPCWRNFRLGERVNADFHVHARVDNDANAAGLAEAIWGAGRGYPTVFYATLGTGIGTGVVFDGKIFHGRTGAAAEGGHVSIDYRGPKCGCGKRGCIEALASGPAVGARARAAIAENKAAGAKMLSLAGGKLDGVTAEIVGAAFHAGDPLAKAVLHETAEYLAIWLGNMIDILEPHVIIFGGGMGMLMSEWFDFIRQQLPSWSINQRCKEIPLLLARYHEDSGIAGSAALCITV